jgi:hypothetical protein
MLSVSVLPTCSQPDRRKDVVGRLWSPFEACAKHLTGVSLSNENGLKV